MSVHKTDDGRWFVRYSTGKNADHPNKIREYFGRGLDAELQTREKNHELVLGIPIKQLSPTVVELVASYLTAKSPTMPKTSMISLRAKLSAVILPWFGPLMAVEINPEILDQFIKHRLASVKKTTVHRDLSDLRAILRFALHRKYIAANPMQGFNLPTRDDDIIDPKLWRLSKTHHSILSGRLDCPITLDCDQVK